MCKKTLLNLALAFSLLSVSGCGDTTVVTPNDRVIKKEVQINDDGSSKTKETVIHDNGDGTTTKTEKKTETKVKGDGDTLIKLPGIEIKKN